MPAANGKGDQLRAFQFIRELAARHAVEVVTTGAGRGDAAAARAGAARSSSRVTVARAALGVAGALLRGQPAQVGWMTPGPAGGRSQRRAAGADVVLAVTVRAVRGPLPAAGPRPRRCVERRTRGAAPRGLEPAPVRWAARVERRAPGAWERRLARWAARRRRRSRRRRVACCPRRRWCTCCRTASSCTPAPRQASSVTSTSC